MRILLTGGTGQVGSELLSILGRTDNVIAPVREILDLASPDSIAAAVRDARPDLIVNAGAFTDVDRAESEPEAAMAVNGLAPGVLASEALQCGAALVHFSSDYVFDGTKTAPYTENDPTGPLNTYGRTKVAGEQAVVASGCPHLIFRTSWVYGPRGRNFFLTMRRLAGEARSIRVVTDQYGAPTPARLIAEATSRSIAMLSTGGRIDRDQFLARSGTYHMTAAGRTSWHGFASEILGHLGKADALVPISSAEYRAPAARPANSMLDNSRLQERLGIRLGHWREALSAVVRDFEGRR